MEAAGTPATGFSYYQSFTTNPFYFMGFLRGLFAWAAPVGRALFIAFTTLPTSSFLLSVSYAGESHLSKSLRIRFFGFIRWTSDYPADFILLTFSILCGGKFHLSRFSHLSFTNQDSRIWVSPTKIHASEFHLPRFTYQDFNYQRVTPRLVKGLNAIFGEENINFLLPNISIIVYGLYRPLSSIQGERIGDNLCINDFSLNSLPLLAIDPSSHHHLRVLGLRPFVLS